MNLNKRSAASEPAVYSITQQAEHRPGQLAEVEPGPHFYVILDPDLESLKPGDPYPGDVEIGWAWE